jgi:hypothetical protein
MGCAKLIVSFCSQVSEEAGKSRDFAVVHTQSFAVHGRSTVESVHACIEQGCNSVQQVASRLPCLRDEGCLVFDRDDFRSENDTALSGDGSEPAYPIQDIINMAIRFARDEVRACGFFG